MRIISKSILPVKNRLVILMYHRFSDRVTDPWGICVSRENFEQQLEVIRKLAEPVRLNAIAGTKPSRGRRVVVTIDDGYADTLYEGWPLLEKYDVPATLFVATGLLDQKQFWWDELDRLLLGPHMMPPRLFVEIDGAPHEWSFDTPADRSWSANSAWKAWQTASSARQAAFQALYEMLQPRSEELREPVMQQIRTRIRAEDDAEADRPLRTEELLRLSEHDLMDIGAHTVSHPVLSHRTVEVQAREIAGSKAHLESLLNRPVTAFAYPFGRQSDYTQETVDEVRKAGFHIACSNFPGRAGIERNPLELPRMYAGDWDGDEFERRLRRAFIQ